MFVHQFLIDFNTNFNVFTFFGRNFVNPKADATMDESDDTPTHKRHSREEGVSLTQLVQIGRYDSGLVFDILVKTKRKNTRE